MDRALTRRAAAAVLVLVVSGSVWRVAPVVRSRIGTAVTAAMTQQTAAIGLPAAVASGEMPAAVLPRALESGTPSAATAGRDSSVWVPAVARTWVNVRADASRGGEVIGVIRPSSRAMLGSNRAGWRQVRSPDAIGWVDPRLFEPDSTRPRGE